MTFQGKIIVFRHVVYKQVDCILNLWVYLRITIFKTPMNLRNSYAEVGYLQSNKYKNHIPSDVNDPSGGLGVLYFSGGLMLVAKQEGLLNRTSNYVNHCLPNILKVSVFLQTQAGVVPWPKSRQFMEDFRCIQKTSGLCVFCSSKVEYRKELSYLIVRILVQREHSCLWSSAHHAEKRKNGSVGE